jgi:hypothetical protein
MHAPSAPQSLSDIHTLQINVISAQVFAHTAALQRLQHELLMQSALIQKTALHISKVDSRVPSFKVISATLKTLVSRLNEVILRVREPFPEKADTLEELKMLNLELGLGELFENGGRSSGSSCNCECNEICIDCFPL